MNTKSSQPKHKRKKKKPSERSKERQVTRTVDSIESIKGTKHSPSKGSNMNPNTVVSNGQVVSQ